VELAQHPSGGAPADQPPHSAEWASVRILTDIEYRDSPADRPAQRTGQMPDSSIVSSSRNPEKRIAQLHGYCGRCLRIQSYL